MPSTGGIPHLCFWGQSPSSEVRSPLFRSSIDWCPNQRDKARRVVDGASQARLSLQTHSHYSMSSPLNTEPFKRFSAERVVIL